MLNTSSLSNLEKPQKSLITIILIVLVLAAAAAGLYYTHTMEREPMMPESQVRIGTTTIAVERAVTPAQQEAGLSGRTALAQGRGMLFVFNDDSMRGIWMKDMKFPIDIVFISQTGEVVSVAPDVSPDTYPKMFYPPRPVRYVLELPAGFAAAHAIAEGAKVVL